MLALLDNTLTAGLIYSPHNSQKFLQHVQTPLLLANTAAICAAALLPYFSINPAKIQSGNISFLVDLKYYHCLLTR